MTTTAAATRSPLPFSLGQTVMTPAVLETIPMEWAASCLDRHKAGDWGNVSPGDARENTLATHTGDRILSSYEEGGLTLWIITEADRSVTTLLLPSDY